jgi:sugar transport protein
VTGFFGVVKVVGVLIFQLFVLDRIGRRSPFMVGAAAMGSFMLIIACIVATHEPSATATQQGATGAGIAAVIMIYAEAFSFNMSWGPLPWLYLGEIFSNRTREIGIAIGAASQWLFNFVMSQMTPHAIANIGWRTFLIFAIFNYAIIIYSWMFLKEVRTRSFSRVYPMKLPFFQAPDLSLEYHYDIEHAWTDMNTHLDSWPLARRNASHFWRTSF